MWFFFSFFLFFNIIALVRRQVSAPPEQRDAPRPDHQVTASLAQEEETAQHQCTVPGQWLIFGAPSWTFSGNYTRNQPGEKAHKKILQNWRRLFLPSKFKQSVHMYGNTLLLGKICFFSLVPHSWWPTYISCTTKKWFWTRFLWFDFSFIYWVVGIMLWNLLKPLKPSGGGEKSEIHDSAKMTSSTTEA